MSKVSVITPAYNASRYLAEAVASVQSQTFSDWEMIIVDDCSTDNTYELACSLAEKDKRIIIIKHENNSGVATARNTALEAATGDFIAFLDSDDLWMPDKLEKQLTFMENNDYALTYTMYQKFQSDTGQRGKIIKAKEKMTAAAIYGNTSIGCLTVMVNRKKVGEFRMPLIKHTEDNCTWQEILSRGFVAYGLKENLALYRESNASLTNNKKKAAKQQWDTYRKYYKFSVLRSAFYFSCYAFNAVKKHF
jgi:teichuronic acid biosynthesis glycosyltransferase TuaG